MAEHSLDCDIFDFPGDEDTCNLLSWMGDDYVAYVVESLSDGLRRQDPDMQIVALRCQARPEFLTRVREDTNTIVGMQVTFPLQILVRDGVGQHWRLFGAARFVGDHLDDPDFGAVRYGLDIERDEPAS